MQSTMEGRPGSDASLQAYHAYLLRCWKEKEDGGFTWRFVLIHFNNAQTKEGFTCLEDLLNYLRCELK